MSWLFWVAICCSDCVWVSVAVWAIMSALLMGLLGSWYFISATSSFRKVFDPIWSGRSTLVVAEFVAMDDAPLTGSVMGGSSPVQTRTSTPRDVDRVEAGICRLSPLSAVRDHERTRPSDHSG